MFAVFRGRFDAPPPHFQVGTRIDGRVRQTSSSVLLAVAFSALLVAPTGLAVVVVLGSVALLALDGGAHATGSRSPASTAFVQASALTLIAVIVPFVDAPFGARSALVVAQFAVVPLIALLVGGAPRGRTTADDLHRAVVAGAVLSGLVAIVQVGVLGNPRAEGATANAIVFGDLALLLAVMALALRPTQVDAAELRPARDGTWAAVALGFVAAIASGTRGVIVAAPVLLLVVLACRPELRPRRSWRTPGVLVAAIVTGVLAVGLARGVLVRRLSTVLHDVQIYVGAAPSDVGAETSIGARFEAWRATLSAFWHDPLSGIGWGNLGGLFDAQVAAGQRNERIATFEHAHQQLLGSLASGGILGAAAMVAVLAVPAWWFRRAIRRGGVEDRRVGAAGLVVISGFAVFGLTESIFESFAPVAFYAVAIATLMALLRSDEWTDRHAQTAGVQATSARR